MVLLPMLVILYAMRAIATVLLRNKEDGISDTSEYATGPREMSYTNTERRSNPPIAHARAEDGEAAWGIPIPPMAR